MSSVSSGDATVRQLRVVDEQAPAPAHWETVYRDHVAPLFRYVYARTGNRPDAEDVTATTFMRALPKMRSDASPLEMRAYLRTTARTVVADLWRERHGYADQLNEDLVSAAHEPESSEEADVEGLLSPLPPHYREVLELRFLRGYSIKETAAAMGISVSNAKVMQLRALRRAAGQSEQAS